MMNDKAMDFKLVLGREDPPTRKHRLRKRVSENAIRERGNGWCEMNGVRVAWWGVIVPVCACHLSVCVSVCMWVPDLGLNRMVTPRSAVGGTLSRWKSRNAGMRPVRLRWEVKGSERAGLMAGSVSYVSSAEGFEDRFWKRRRNYRYWLSFLLADSLTRKTRGRWFHSCYSEGANGINYHPIRNIPEAL